MSKPAKKETFEIKDCVDQVAKITGFEKDGVSAFIELWEARDLFPPREFAAAGQRSSGARYAIVVASIAVALVRLHQIGVADEIIDSMAELLGKVAYSAQAKSPELWIAFASGQDPVVLISRTQLIDKLARSKGLGMTILDLATIMQQVAE